MHTGNITNTILQLTRAIDCLSAAQSEPMEVKHRMAIGREIQTIFAIIADISGSHTRAGGEQ